jgi:copper chaperone CopZ
MKRIILLTLTAMMALGMSSAMANEGTAPVVQTEKKTKKAKAEIKEVNFHVHLHCNNCVKKVQDNIAFEKGVKDLHVTQHSILIKYDAAKTSEAVLKAAIEKLGYKILEETHDHHHHN